MFVRSHYEVDPELFSESESEFLSLAYGLTEQPIAAASRIGEYTPVDTVTNVGSKHCRTLRPFKLFVSIKSSSGACIDAWIPKPVKSLCVICGSRLMIPSDEIETQTP